MSHGKNHTSAVSASVTAAPAIATPALASATAASASATNGALDVMAALQEVLKLALTHDGLAHDLHEANALDQGRRRRVVREVHRPLM
jgi:hypothetical protein